MPKISEPNINLPWMISSSYATPNFSWAELTYTSTGIENSFDEAWHRKEMQMTACVLELVRGLAGNKPLIITSGYRNKAVNEAVGGSPSSDHLKGRAVDFRPLPLPKGGLGLACFQLAFKIVDSWICFDQLILYDTHVHFGLGPKSRRQIMTSTNGSLVKGLIRKE